jgi:hypothetical protein
MVDVKEEESASAADARRKRKAILTKQQRHDDLDIIAEAAAIAARTASGASACSENDQEQEGDESSLLSGSNGNKKTKRAQIRYDPDEPMDKTELANWRREHRRVRNRESAAASRQRIRSRITELEDEVDQWKHKYNTALQRLNHLRETTSASTGLPVAHPSLPDPPQPDLPGSQAVVKTESVDENGEDPRRGSRV